MHGAPDDRNRQRLTTTRQLLLINDTGGADFLDYRVVVVLERAGSVGPNWVCKVSVQGIATDNFRQERTRTTSLNTIEPSARRAKTQAEGFAVAFAAEALSLSQDRVGLSSHGGWLDESD